MNVLLVRVSYLFLVILFSAASYSAKSESLECHLPIAFGWESGMPTPVPAPAPAPAPLVPPTLPFSKDVVANSKTAVASASIIGVLCLSPVAAMQGIRTALTLDIANCNKSMELDLGPLPWYQSPTRLVLGEDELRYDKGAVVGNWLVFTGAVFSHTALAKIFGSATMRYPGALVLPAFLLLPGMTLSAVELLRFGEVGEIALGAALLGAETLGTIGVVIFLLSSRFHDPQNIDEVAGILDEASKTSLKQYGFLFNSFRNERRWFLGVEFAFSATTATLAAYQTLQSNCVGLLSTAAVAYGSYAAAVLILRPSKSTVSQVYLSAISTLQFSGVVLDLVGDKVDAPQVREAGNGLIVFTQWAVTAYSILHGTYRIHSMLKPFLRGMKLRYDEIEMKRLFSTGSSYSISDPFVEVNQ